MLCEISSSHGGEYDVQSCLSALEINYYNGNFVSITMKSMNSSPEPFHMFTVSSRSVPVRYICMLASTVFFFIGSLNQN